MNYGLIIGQPGGDRSAAAREAARRLQERGLRVAGFTQRTREVGAGRRSIEVARVPGGAPLVLATTRPDPGAAPAVCSYAFERAAFDEVLRWVMADGAAAQVLVLDGLGKLELGGGGHRRAVEHALRAGPPVVLTVRRDHLVYALEGLGLEAPLASYATDEGAAAFERFLQDVELAARPHRAGRS